MKKSLLLILLSLALALLGIGGALALAQPPSITGVDWGTHENGNKEYAYAVTKDGNKFTVYGNFKEMDSSVSTDPDQDDEPYKWLALVFTASSPVTGYYYYPDWTGDTGYSMYNLTELADAVQQGAANDNKSFVLWIKCDDPDATKYFSLDQEDQRTAEAVDYSVALQPSYKVTFDFEHLSASGDHYVAENKNYQATLSPNSDYELPADVTVEVDGSELDENVYSYNSSTGVLTVPKGYIDGDIVITAAGVKESAVPTISQVSNVSPTDLVSYNLNNPGATTTEKENHQHVLNNCQAVYGMSTNDHTVFVYGDSDQMDAYNNGAATAKWYTLRFLSDTPITTAAPIFYCMDDPAVNFTDLTPADSEYVRKLEGQSVVNNRAFALPFNAAQSTTRLTLSNAAMNNQQAYNFQFVESYYVDTKLRWESSYAVEFTATNGYRSWYVPKVGADYTANISSNGTYLLPNALTVKVGNTVLSAADYTYTPNTARTSATLSIPAGKITGELTIAGGSSTPVAETGDVMFSLAGYYTDTAKTPAQYYTREYLPLDDADYPVPLGAVSSLYLTVYAEDMDDYDPTVKYGSTTLAANKDTVKIDGDTFDRYVYTVTSPTTSKDLTLTFEDGDYEDCEYTFDTEGVSLTNIQLSKEDDDSYVSSKAVSLLPAFDPAVRDYTLLIPYDDDYSDYMPCTLQLTFDESDPELHSLTSGLVFEEGSTSKKYIAGFEVNEGTGKIFSFSVDGLSYSVTVVYAADGGQKKYTLSGLALFDDDDLGSGDELELTPEFDEEVYAYAVKDKYATDDKLYLEIKTKDDYNCRVLVNGQLQTLDDGECVFEFVPADYSAIDVTVYSENLKNSQTYTLNLSANGVGALSGMALYDGTRATQYALSPAFSATTYGYVANFGNDMNAISLYLASANSLKVSQKVGSTYYVNGLAVTSGAYTNFTLYEGLNEFDIVAGTQHYYLNVYREPLTTTIVTSSQYLAVDNGTAQIIPAFNINGNNFVQLRSVAYLLKDTPKKFSVTYAYTAATNYKAIYLARGGAYTTFTGQEMIVPSTYTRAVVSPQHVLLNNAVSYGEVYPMAYNIDGYNYYLLRDLASLLNFDISYEGNTVLINSAKTYLGGN